MSTGDCWVEGVWGTWVADTTWGTIWGAKLVVPFMTTSKSNFFANLSGHDNIPSPKIILSGVLCLWVSNARMYIINNIIKYN